MAVRVREQCRRFFCGRTFYYTINNAADLSPFYCEKHRSKTTTPPVVITKTINPATYQNNGLRERSGSVNIDSRLVGFLYTLIRDHMPAEIVEGLVRDLEKCSSIEYTNGWIAKYCEDVANRLKQ